MCQDRKLENRFSPYEAINTEKDMQGVRSENCFIVCCPQRYKRGKLKS